MLSPPHPIESERLAVLRGLSILDTPREESFDEITQYASKVCDAPIALISFVDEDRQWFKSSCGFDQTETSRDTSVCAHALEHGDYLEIEDLTQDPRTMANSLVTGDEKMRFYAGAVLKTSDGVPLGTLCVLDRRPRKLESHQREALMFLSKQVMAQVELRRSLEHETALRGEIDHRVKNSLQTVASILRVQRATVDSAEAKEAISAAERRIKTISLLHNELYSTESYQALELSRFVGRLCGLLRVTLPDGIRLNSSLDAIVVPSGKAKSLAMIVGEFIANSAKHAFAEGQSGQITVEGHLENDGGYALWLYDDGRGLDGDPLQDSGLGQKIIAASVDQLGGSFCYCDPPHGKPGTCLHITFQPAPPETGD